MMISHFCSNGTLNGTSWTDCCQQCEGTHVDFFSQDGTCYCATPGEVGQPS